MPATKCVAYLRVSTAHQGKEGLGIDAQRAAVAAHVRAGDMELIEEVVEVESGKVSDRPELTRALAACRIHGATLIVAKLDRLSRNARFLLGLEAAGVNFVCCDMPSANRLTVGIMAVVAEEEGRMISARTKAALAAAKARGTRLGNPANLTIGGRERGRQASAARRAADGQRWRTDVAPVLRPLVAEGLSLRRIADSLNERGLPARRGGKWTAAQVRSALLLPDLIPAYAYLHGV